jgi:hypothetical protein
MNDSSFLNSLIGKPVRIVCRDHVPAAECPLILKEVSGLGLVADDGNHAHFFAWAEVVEVESAEVAAGSEESILACFSESEI